MNPPGFWRTVQLLLAASRTRSAGRSRRQQELTQQRSGSDWSFLAAFFAVLLAIGINVVAAFVLNNAVKSGQRVEVERQGKIVVSMSFLNAANDMQEQNPEIWRQWGRASPP